MEKRERLEHLLAGDVTDRVPVAFWRPFPGDDQRTADLAAAIDFQLRYDWDMCVIVRPGVLPGQTSGCRTNGPATRQAFVPQSAIPSRRSLDWTDLRAPDPSRGEYGRLAGVVKAVCEGPQAFPLCSKSSVHWHRPHVWPARTCWCATCEPALGMAPDRPGNFIRASR